VAEKDIVGRLASKEDAQRGYVVQDSAADNAGRVDQKSSQMVLDCCLKVLKGSIVRDLKDAVSEIKQCVPKAQDTHLMQLCLVILDGIFRELKGPVRLQSLTHFKVPHCCRGERHNALSVHCPDRNLWILYQTLNVR
jgi:hypothetical protein